TAWSAVERALRFSFRSPRRLRLTADEATSEREQRAQGDAGHVPFFQRGARREGVEALIFDALQDRHAAAPGGVVLHREPRRDLPDERLAAVEHRAGARDLESHELAVRGGRALGEQVLAGDREGR